MMFSAILKLFKLNREDLQLLSPAALAITRRRVQAGSAHYLATVRVRPHSVAEILVIQHQPFKKGIAVQMHNGVQGIFA